MNRFLFFLLFFIIGLKDPLSAQGQCDQISFNFDHYDPCHFRLTYDNSTECYTELQLVLEQGQFASWNVIPNSGFIVQQISPSELTITHSGGFLPLGFQVPVLFTLPVDLVTNVGVYYLNNCAPAAFCTYLPTPVLESCPDPHNASISGTVYRECGGLPYINQATLPDWTVQLLDDMGNVLQEQVTDAGGSYAFFDLAVGSYTVKTVGQPNWTPSVPLSGQSAVSLNASEQKVRNFGNCRVACLCSSVKNTIQNISSSPSSCCYSLNTQIFGGGDFCFQYINIKVGAGQTIPSWVAQPGWTFNLINPTFLQIIPPSGVVPAGNSFPGTFCVAGGTTQTIVATAGFTDSGGTHECNSDFSFTCPPPQNACACPNGAMPGSNLVTNGDFSSNGSFNSGYSLNNSSPLLEGQYWIGSNPALINPGFQACKDHSSGTGNMMVVNGAGNTNTTIWCQTIAVNPNTNYQFGVWIASLAAASPAQLQLYINNVSVGASFGASATTCNWLQYCQSWKSGTSTSVTLCILNLNATAQGNDFAIDDISFQECIPACVCKQGSELTVSSGATTFTLSCDFHTFLPILPCPTAPVSINSNFGCTNPAGANCTGSIDWRLESPLGNPIATGSQASVLALNLAQGLFSSPGTYYFFMETQCSPTGDTCRCTASWVVESCDTCCLDYDVFCQHIADNILLTVDAANCKATLNIGKLPPCDSVAWVNWGDSPNQFGPFAANSMPMHAYSGSGNYIISYLVLEYRPNGTICFEKIIRDTITLDCGGICSCGNGNLQNLVTNGNFSLGNYGFSSELLWSGNIPGNCGSGSYGLYTDFANFCNGWGPLTDHTSGTGLFLNFDGFVGTVDDILWQSQVTLMSQSDYCFSFWWALGFANPSQNFQVSVDIVDANGIVQSNLGIVNIANSTTWTNLGSTFNWNSLTLSGTYYIAIRQLSPGGFRDWGIDDICFTKIPKACDCKTGDLTYSSGGVDHTIPCQAGPSFPVFFCPTAPVTICGNFGCVDANGNSCPTPPAPINWILYGPNGIIQQNTILTGSPWCLPFTAADLAGSGFFTLYMTTLCPGQADSCKCVATWFQECAPCKCTPNSWANEIRYGGAQNSPVQCGQTVNVTTGSAFYPNFLCQGGNCGRVDWVLKDPGGNPIASMIGVIPNASGGFVIPQLQPTNFPNPGTYCLEMRGICGQDTCPCNICFCLPPQAPTLNDTSVCRTLSSAYIPLYGCPTSCGVTQVQWFVKACSAANFPPNPYQVSSGPGCDPLLLLPYQYPGEACVQVYAVVTLAPGCCVPTLTTNIATINLCNPISCSITNLNPAYCQTGQPTALTAVLSGANCNNTIEWYNDNNQLVSTAMTYTPSVLNFPTVSTACYKDFTYTLKVKGICGISTCSTTIRVYNNNADNGDLAINPIEPLPLCPGEDVIVEYTDECSGPPPKWTWYSSIDGINYTLIGGAGMMNPIIYSNRLWQTTWFMVESNNGVCPPKQEVLKVDVKDPLSIVNFTAIPDPCIENYVVLTVDFTPTPNAGGGQPGCGYTIEWYKDGNLIHSSNSQTSPVSYTYTQSGSVAGIYYAIVKDNCCNQAVQTWPQILNPSCEPVIGGPCYICDNGPVTLIGEMVLPPNNTCLNDSCKFQWYRLDIITGVWLAITNATLSNLTITAGGHYRFESVCDYGYGPCIKSYDHDVAQCNGCMYVGEHEVTLPAELKVDIQPNPTAGNLTVQISPLPLRKGRVEIVDLSGKVLTSGQIQEGQSSLTLSLAPLPTGLYFVRVYESDVLLWTGKVVRAE